MHTERHSHSRNDMPSAELMYAFAKVAASDLQIDPTLRACGTISHDSFATSLMSDENRPIFVWTAIFKKLCSEHRFRAGCGVTLGRRRHSRPDAPANQRAHKLERWHQATYIR